MGGKKTQDGIKLEKIVRVAERAGISVRKGRSHKYVLQYTGQRPCPLDTSTNAKTMVVPWLEKDTTYNRKVIYSALRIGAW